LAEIALVENRQAADLAWAIRGAACDDIPVYD
jgi:hypothetical protein